MRAPVVLVSQLPHMFEMLPDLLADAGCAVRRTPPGGGLAAMSASTLADVDGLVGIFADGRVTAEVLARMPRLRVVTSPVIGTDTIDVAACTAAGVLVAFGPIAENVIGMAEANVMLVAALRKRLLPKIGAVADGSWVTAGGPGQMVRGAVVGFVGYGEIARATARLLAGWGCDLAAHDPYVSAERMHADAVTPMGRDELLAAADVVIVGVPLTDETRHLIGRGALGLMRPTSLLINTARGALVDEVALRDALDAGGIAGAAIDTWECEGPGSRSPLRGHPSVISTGHDVGHSVELYERHPLVARDNTIAALRGDVPEHVKNVAVLRTLAAAPRPARRCRRDRGCAMTSIGGEGRVAIVTGAGRGLGREYALALASNGYRIVVNDVGTGLDGRGDAEAVAEAVVEEIRAAGAEAIADTHDVGSFTGAEALVSSAVSTFGDLHVVVNNAGIVRDRMLVNMSEDEFDDVVRVHLKGTFAVSRHAGDHWRARSKTGQAVDARLINTTSLAGTYANPGQTNYGAAKAGIVMLTEIAALELARYGVTANAISPLARTRMSIVDGVPADGDDPGRDELWPGWVTPLVVWLASPASSTVTGRVFEASGRHLAVVEGRHRGPTAPAVATVDEVGAVVASLIASALPNAGIDGLPGTPPQPQEPARSP